MKKPLTQGNVIKWMINPHSWFHLEVKDPNGEVVEWMIEGGSELTHPSGVTGSLQSAWN